MFLVHVALEAPFAIQGLFAGTGLPVLDATNTTLVFIKVGVGCQTNALGRAGVGADTLFCGVFFWLGFVWFRFLLF